jgi:hypothetical protein
MNTNNPVSNVIPYDGMVHKSGTHDIYSDHSNNMMPKTAQYKYNNTTAYNTRPIKKDVWKDCRKRGGVIHNDKDHTDSDSKMDSDNVTEESMKAAYDTGNYGKVNGDAYKTLSKYDINSDGNVRDSNIRDYFVYGAYTANGTFIDNGVIEEDPSCTKTFRQAVPVQSTYSPREPKKKTCAPDGYQYANGEVDSSVSLDGRGAKCNSLYREFEDHNTNYVQDHYDQFNPTMKRVSQEELDKYKTNFMLLSGDSDGNTNYRSYGGNVNPSKMNPRTRMSNSHISL